MAAQEERLTVEQLTIETDGLDGLGRRAYPRHAVDCAVTVTPLSGAAQITGKLSDLSLGGCLVVMEQRYVAGILVRAEVHFQLRGVAFRFAGVTVGTRGAKSFAVRFVDMPARRRDGLAEVLAEVAAANAAKAAAKTIAGSAAPTEFAATEKIIPTERAMPVRAIDEVAAPLAVLKPAAGKTLALVSQQTAEPISGMRAVQSSALPMRNSGFLEAGSATAAPVAISDRRAHGRHAVDTRAKLLLVNTAISMPGRILNLSMGGCRIRTDARFHVGIYVRVEAEFYLHGLPFRVGGVSQVIQDKNTIGVRFLDMSERRRGLLTELIAEIEEAHALEPGPAEDEKKNAIAEEECNGVDGSQV